MQRLGALKRGHVLVAALICTVCASCTDADRKAIMAGRWGPNPAIQPADANSVIHDQNQVLQYIASEAGLFKVDGTSSYPQYRFKIRSVSVFRSLAMDKMPDIS